MIDQPAPEQRTCAGGECGGARPDPDRRAALLLVKRGADDRQRAGNEQRRPHRSAAAPPINSSADMHSVYALMTHCIAASVVPRSASIVGSATLTTDSSTNAMVDPNTAAASTQGLSRSGQADLPRVERMTCAAQGCVFEVITSCRSCGRVRGQ